jgi:hypothetical protein
MGVNGGSNLFISLSSGASTWLVVWARPDNSSRSVFTDLSSYSKASGMDARSRLIDGSSAVTASFGPTPQAQAFESAIAWPVSSALGSLIGAAPSARVLGYQG